VATLGGTQPAEKKAIERQSAKPVIGGRDAGYGRFMYIISLGKNAQKIANPTVCLKVFFHPG
jgi:hypothetical protein